MKLRSRSTPAGFLVLLLSLALALGFPLSAGAAPGGPTQIDPTLVKKLKDSARGSVTISINDATTFASFIKAGRNGDLLPSVKATPAGKAKGFLKQFGGILGVADAGDLVQTAASTDQFGATHVTYEQRYRGLAVFGGILKAHVDKAGNLTAVNGTIVPAINLAMDPRLSAQEARTRAIAAVKADPPVASTDATSKVGKLRVESARLLVYRTGLVKDEIGTNELVYHVVVTNGKNIRDAVFVHAMTGKVINRYSMVDNALFRRLFEQNTSTQVWQEGDLFPGTLNQDQQNIVNFSGHSYNLFFNAFGRDSYDAAGAELRSVNNDPNIACPNANWNGATTNYCNGVTADDVVAHEWGHAYTQYTHDLIYQWQPGALNESYSDIWGETVDLLNGVGTDSPGGVRTVGACSTHTTPIPVLIINSPTPGECPAGAAAFGAPLTATGVTGDLVLVDDGSVAGTAPGNTTANGCETPFVNAAAIVGKVALLERGVCGFAVKVKNAQSAGAIAAVVFDHTAGAVAGMGGADPTITIPSLRITKAHGDLLKGYLSSGTSNVTLKVKGGTSAPEDSYRWLIGEDATAFGSAIRDMWNPNCKADAGKVSDAEYHCATSDGGGVHSNSGVPNHGYALLVDGGTYNGRTVTGLGLTKAAHLYWRAQSVYQTPTTKFADHADALQASCTDLLGVNLASLSTGADLGPSGQAITAADCAEVADMIAAVELRIDPTQCNFGPALNPNTPKLCGPNQKNPSTHYAEDFEDGLAGWTLTNTGVFSGWTSTVAPIDWAADTSLPDGRAGTAAFAADPDLGDCAGGANDISGVMRLESPAILIPGSATLLPRVVFDHYFATEPGWDGGNVKISINGGAFAIVPASAFTFNGYNATLQTAGAGNTNPLAGESGFSGTDGGEVTGSWGTSQINLTTAGVRPGDSIKLRFEFGRDGCGGRDGWYVDNVKIQSCNARKQP
ncbi:MAG: M4 family metallopeptidase [Candidatus Limnocylindrales bacterium]